jgi:hypothetical protein
MDLRDLRAEALVLWQPDWNVIALDANGGMPTNSLKSRRRNRRCVVR